MKIEKGENFTSENLNNERKVGKTIIRPRLGKNLDLRTDEVTEGKD